MGHVPGRVKRAAREAAEAVGSVYSVSAVVALECERSGWKGAAGFCRNCNAELTERRTAWCSDACHAEFEVNHMWGNAKHACLQQADWTCERDGCDREDDLQVNHIQPVVGRGYAPSCWHHADNLEVLCRPHHQIETNLQRQHRQLHWDDDPLTGTIPVPDPSLPEQLRRDLVKRMLDRRSGWPFLLPGESFADTGLFRRYRPNTSWSAALSDLRQRHPEARVWEPAVQRWVRLSYYGSARTCSARIGPSRRCSRGTDTDFCWQHSTL